MAFIYITPVQSDFYLCSFKRTPIWTLICPVSSLCFPRNASVYAPHQDTFPSRSYRFSSAGWLVFASYTGGHPPWSAPALINVDQMAVCMDSDPSKHSSRVDRSLWQPISPSTRTERQKNTGTWVNETDESLSDHSLSMHLITGDWKTRALWLMDI